MIRSGRDRLIYNSASSADLPDAWDSFDHLVGAGEDRALRDGRGWGRSDQAALGFLFDMHQE